VSGAASWLDRNDAGDLTSVTIAPDLGERYLDTVYQTNWVQELYGDVLDTPERTDTAPVVA
jgi:cysteine synthase A